MSFSSDLEKFARKAGINMSQMVRGTLLTMGKNIILASPVKTGRFRGNWQHNTGTPAAGELDAVDATGGKTIARLNSSVADVKAGGIEYMTNNLPYAIPLEYGSSQQQAPSGMVRNEAARFQRVVAQEVKKIP